MFFVEIFRNAYDSDPPKKPPEQGVWMAPIFGGPNLGDVFSMTFRSTYSSLPKWDEWVDVFPL